MSSKRVDLIFLLVCFISAGCSFFDAKPDPSRFFSLASLSQTPPGARDAAVTEQLVLGVGPIKIPGYLDRQQFVTRISPNRFAVAENDRWAEPLDENFTRVLAQNLAALLQTDRIVTYPWPPAKKPEYRVEIEVLRFESNAAREAELSARWNVIDVSGKAARSFKESRFTRPAKENSVDGTVAALSETVADLSREIANAINIMVAQREQ